MVRVIKTVNDKAMTSEAIDQKKRWVIQNAIATNPDDYGVDLGRFLKYRKELAVTFTKSISESEQNFCYDMIIDCNERIKTILGID